MIVFINGAARPFPGVLTMQDLLCALEMENQRLAIELNGEILPRRLFPEVSLSDGDRVEIVHAIGGG